jgi:hypothetical protein
VAVRLDISTDPLAKHSLSPVELKELMATERAGRPFLVFRDQSSQLRMVAIGGGGQTLTLGRRPEVDVAIDWDGEVSGLHAELHNLGGEWTIVDDGLSRNGTFVNERRVSGRHRLQDRDRIRVGQTILVYRVGISAVVPKTVASTGRLAPPPLTDAQRRVLVALCRPLRDGDGFGPPATNQQIAAELFLSVEAVKMHLRTLFAKFELSDLAQNEKRARLADSARQAGLVTPHDVG